MDVRLTYGPAAVIYALVALFAWLYEPVRQARTVEAERA